MGGVGAGATVGMAVGGEWVGAAAGRGVGGDKGGAGKVWRSSGRTSD